MQLIVKWNWWGLHWALRSWDFKLLDCFHVAYFTFFVNDYTTANFEALQVINRSHHRFSWVILLAKKFIKHKIEWAIKFIAAGYIHISVVTSKLYILWHYPTDCKTKKVFFSKNLFLLGYHFKLLWSFKIKTQFLFIIFSIWQMRCTLI